ncbi:unnamed protein product, partial [Timema podura]|nr:unnamed protein product [Timema podura]
MNMTNLDECIHIVDDGISLEKVLRSITEFGVQEDAFYVFDVGDIVRKYEIFTSKLPRVTPFYGKYIITISVVNKVKKSS